MNFLYDHDFLAVGLKKHIPMLNKALKSAGIEFDSLWDQSAQYQTFHFRNKSQTAKAKTIMNKVLDMSAEEKFWKAYG